MNTENEIWRILDSIKTYYQDHLWDSWVKAYKNYFWYKLDRWMLIEDFQTNVKVPIVKMHVDSMWTWIYDNQLNFRVVGRGKDDQKKAADAKSFLEWGFSASDSLKELMWSAKEALIAGNWYWEIWYVDKSTVIEYKKWLKTVKKTIKEQFPYVSYVWIFNLFFDPSVENMEDSHFVCVRRLLNKNQFIKKYNSRIENIETKVATAIAKPRYFSTMDYWKIKHSIFWSKDTINGLIDSNWTNEFDIWKKNYLTVDYKDQYVEVIEYWEDNRLCILLNGHLVKDWINPMPIKKKPFYNLIFNKAPWLAYWIWLWQSLDDIQQVSDEILNLTVDNIKLQIAPMFQKMKWWDLFWKGNTWKLKYQPFGMLETNTPNAISRLDLWTPDFSWVQILQFLMQLWEMAEGMNAYTMGSQNKVERSAWAVSALVQASKSRLLPLTQSINHALSKIAEMWIWLAIAKMDDSISLRSIDDTWRVSFKDLNLEDIIGKYDIEFDAQSLKSASREVRRNQLNNILQTAVSAWIEPNTQQYIIDMKWLWKKIFEAYELPQDLVLNSKDIIKDTTKLQIDMQKAQQKIQESQPQPQYQQPQFSWGTPWWAPVLTEEPVAEPDVEWTTDSDMLREALTY